MPPDKITPHVITLRWLQRRGACSDQQDIFKETFGTAAVMTEKNLKKAEKAGLSLRWLIRNLSRRIGVKNLQVWRNDFDGLETEYYNRSGTKRAMSYKTYHRRRFAQIVKMFRAAGLVE